MYKLCHDQHWTLLVRIVKKKYCAFFYSSPKATHRAILKDFVHKLHEDVGQTFDTNIREWTINYLNGVPTQENNIDCNMFMCKYMEELVKHEHVN
ncbi:Putative ubiquitin-like-specific protease 1B [Dendrobium catenatum]|uniref:Ubiquitin-like-specific protease 1B n=1 Tax=Dendrobium catenatum TaxID=906689 RepID=A0A2I0WVU5_9ASPA|nr:Putative ubiquitin-like-specific protease 1B [Dendrobium catenatum]